jgi:hypothetical protein
MVRVPERICCASIEFGLCGVETGMSNSAKLEEWLARCRWLKSTRLDEKTRLRLDLLIADLERDIEDQRDERRYERRWIMRIGSGVASSE